MDDDELRSIEQTVWDQIGATRSAGEIVGAIPPDLLRAVVQIAVAAASAAVTEYVKRRMQEGAEPTEGRAPPTR